MWCALTTERMFRADVYQSVRKAPTAIATGGGSGIGKAVALLLAAEGAAVEVANAICFMASSDAAYITGQTLSVDGGLTMS